MEFGDRLRFSIELDLDENPGGAWIFGRFCYWIDGQVVGDRDLGASLRDVLFQMTPILGDRGCRRCPKLISFSGQEIFELISASLDRGEDEIRRYVPEGQPIAALDVRIPVDVFDKWKIFLVEDTDAAKLVYRGDDAAGVEVVVLQEGEFDEVFLKAFTHLDGLFRKYEGLGAGGLESEK